MSFAPRSNLSLSCKDTLQVRDFQRSTGCMFNEAGLSQTSLSRSLMPKYGFLILFGGEKIY